MKELNMADMQFIQDALDRKGLLSALRAFRKGDFSVRLPMDLTGIDGEIAQAFNDVVEGNEKMTDEFARIRDEVGREGQINQRVRLASANGSWAACVDSVNTLIGDLVRPSLEVARVIESVAKGDLSQRMSPEMDGRALRGEFLRIGKVVNTMVDQLGGFASEVSRVAREVGTDGKLGGQAQVPGVAGTWKDLTDNVNAMAANLTGQVRNIAEVTTAVAKGDLTKKIAVDVKGEILELKSTINTMVDQLNGFASEVSRVAREVGTDGKLGGQAQVPGVAGTWKDLTDNVNLMAANLTGQVRNIAEVTTAVAKGDLTKKIAVDVKGEILELKSTINTMVDQLNGFASEVSRVAREVGTDGKLGGQAQVPGVAGTWKDLTDNVNLMAANLTGQVRNIAEVTTAVAKGDLSKKIAVDVKGEILELKSTINTMVDQLNGFASEVSRVAREVGTDGKLGGQAQVPGVAGTWKDLTDNVNLMAANLTGQVRNIAEVTTAVAKGDLSKKIAVDVKGEILELKSTINTMVDQLNGFASEVSRVAREVGTDGKLGGQAQVPGVAGTWKDLTDNVNAMAANLTGQVRNIAEVTTAVAKGDLSKKITVDVKGEILELKSTINTMLDQLNGFASEVSRVAREVGTDGKLGGQAQVPGVAGTWKDLTDNVNAMAANLTGQVRNIAEVTTAVAKGDLSKKIAVDVKGEILELKSTINTMVDQLNGFASEVSRVAREVGTDGKLGGQAQVPGVAGTWKDLTDNVNLMAANLTGQVRNIAEVTTAVAKGDLSKKITVDVKGEILELKSTINTMLDQLNGFASEVSRVAREVGTDGKLGGQARVPAVAGTWKDLTDNVNSMAANLTNQVRGIAQVVNAVAKGDLKRKVVFEAKGEIAALADTINGMIDTLATFGDQVTNVAREVGIEGKLGGQAKVPGAAGLWRDLTDNVNQLAANLTTQVRAIAEVATAVTKGDLTRSIMVETMGEVAVLKDNINEMIRNLKDTTLKNNEQDWLKTNLAKFTQMLQGHSDLVTVAGLVLSELAPLVSAQQGVVYSQSKRGEEPRLELLAAYASKPNKSLAKTLRIGEGLVGQCALEKKRILLEDVPHDYIRINSVLGSTAPANVIILPVLFEGEVKAVVELASLRRFSEAHLSFLEQLTESIGIVFNTIEANMRTEALLEQSQSLTKELQSQQEVLKNTNDRLEQQADNLQKSESLLKNQQEELQSTNEELQDKAKLLSEQMQQVAYKNREVEHAKAALEEKAEQLALSSRYKSEFLANMSHELRTPLNSLLILAKLLSDNVGNNLMPKQIDYAQTIYAAGTDLLSLINDILDLAKIESGTVTLDIAPERFAELLGYVERTFRQVAQSKGLEFTVEVDPALPAVIQTDEKRLQQILKNLLSNAFKFTEQGAVALRISTAASGWSEGHIQLDAASKVVAFAVSDTGIGIPEVKQKVIFEAFQQVDGSTSRKYGGTGLGLSISRELTRLLGGDIQVESSSGAGSTFTLFLPLVHEPTAIEARAPVSVEDLRERAKRSTAKVKAARGASPRPAVVDDREDIQPGDLVVLIVEDDEKFASTLRDMANESGFKAVLAFDAGTALNLVKELAPDAITLDLRLPDMEGWAILDILKHDPETRHIPVSVISVEREMQKYLHMGALGVVHKPAEKEALMDALARARRMIEHDIKTLLVVSGDDAERASVSEAIRGEGVRITELQSGAEAVEALREGRVDCLVVGQTLSDMSGGNLVKEIARSQIASELPIVMYWTDNSAGGERDKLRKLAEAVVLKSAQTLEAVLAETTLFLHQAVNGLSPSKRRQLLAVMHGEAPDLAGKKALIVDDDIRNIFALTGALEQHGMAVLNAENGKDGIESLKNNPDTDVVLMDIMMPELDGYDTIRIMRGLEEFKDLPIIAVTAKAMKGDREKCIEAGASDYISKPVNVEQLLSLLRVRLAA